MICPWLVPWVQTVYVAWQDDTSIPEIIYIKFLWWGMCLYSYTSSSCLVRWLRCRSDVLVCPCIGANAASVTWTPYRIDHSIHLQYIWRDKMICIDWMYLDCINFLFLLCGWVAFIHVYIHLVLPDDWDVGVMSWFVHVSETTQHQWHGHPTGLITRYTYNSFSVTRWYELIRCILFV